jgi:DNA-binding response OmpR family regulator
VEERATVVVASASEGVRAQLRLTLGDERFEVLEAEDARSAAATIAQSRPELVVLDTELPGGGASSFATSLRAQPETASVRILVLAPRDQAADGLPDAVDATVGLPATSFALLRRIEELLADQLDP